MAYLFLNLKQGTSNASKFGLDPNLLRNFGSLKMQKLGHDGVINYVYIFCLYISTIFCERKLNSQKPYVLFDDNSILG